MHRSGHTIAALVVGDLGRVTLLANPTSPPAVPLRAGKTAPPPALLSAAQPLACQTPPSPGPATSAAPRAVIDKYCITCHNQRLHTAGLELDSLDLTNPAAHAEMWEKVITKLRAGSMPPPGLARPDKATYRAVASSLERDIDRAWEGSPNPGRIGAVHRLNRAEYHHAIRDLFALDLDMKPLLPGDETADGAAGR